MDLLGKTSCNHIVGIPPVAYILDTCPRCLRMEEYGGVAYDTGGKVQTITGVSQIGQQIRKILTENIRSSGYGFDYSLLRGVIDSPTISVIKNEVVRCITYLYNLQQQSKKEGFNYRPDEEISSIQSVDAYQSTTEPRTVVVALIVLTVSGAQASVTLSLKR